MGFNKRIVTRESILRGDDNYLKSLLKADALIMDTWASSFYSLYASGLTKGEILLMFQ